MQNQRNQNQSELRDNYPQPFKVGDFVKVNPEFEDMLSKNEKHWARQKMHIIEIKWIGFGDDDNPLNGCESGWLVSANLITFATRIGGMNGWDSAWFVKWEE